MDREILKNNILNFDNFGLIKWFRGKPVVTLNDFERLSGIDLMELDPFFKPKYFNGGVDWNGLGLGELRKEFEMTNNVVYEDETLLFLYLPGFIKALMIINVMKDIKVVDYNREDY